MSNLQTLHAIYEAFGRGDVASILDRCSDSVEWEYGGSSTTAPWLAPAVGKENVINTLAGNAAIEILNFVPTAFIEGDNVIIVLFNTVFTVKKTGKRVVEEDAVHIWRFDSEGKVCRFRHRIDTHQQQLATEA
jgi:ketosteroid isomerase-like protein